VFFFSQQININRLISRRNHQLKKTGAQQHKGKETPAK
jgi:hypothetical protein